MKTIVESFVFKRMWMDVVLVSFVWEIVWMDAKGEGFKGVKIGLDGDSS